MTLFLTEADVQRLVDMPATIAAVEESFRELAAGRAQFVPRQRAHAPGIVLHTMSAAAEYLGVVGWKSYTTTRTAAHFHLALYEQASGKLLALVEADQLGRLRTGATTGVAVKHLASAELDRLGLFGVGKQARTQLTAVCAVRPIRQALVYSRDAARRQAFCDEMSRELGISITPVEQPEDAVRGLPLVITATSSAKPVFDGSSASDGALVCAIGSNWLNRAEIDETVVRRAERVVCDSVLACQHEGGDFSAAIATGAFQWSQAVDLADIVSGKLAVPSLSSGLTLFKSVGLASEDVALAAVIVERAKSLGVGQSLPL